MANQILKNVEGAYSTNADGTVAKLSYADITSGKHNGTVLANAIDVKAVTYTMELHKAFTDMHRSTLAIGYNFNEIMQGDTLKKMGYANVSEFSESVFDYAGSTALMYANIARQFVVYEPENEYQYHSVFAEFVKNEETETTDMFDFSMGQLQEMLIPQELKIDSIEVWKMLFSKRSITTTTKIRRIRTIRHCIATLAKNNIELTNDNIMSLLKKSLRLETTPEKAFGIVETTAIGIDTTPNGTADTTPNSTADTAPNSTEDTAPNDTVRTLKERCFDSIQTFIENGTLSEKIHANVSNLAMYMQFAQENNSDIVKTALTSELYQFIDDFVKNFCELTTDGIVYNHLYYDVQTPTEETPTEETPTEETPTEETPTEETPTEETPTEETPTEETPTKKTRKTGKKH